MESNDIDRDGAAAQLAALHADRAALAERVIQPWWHDVAGGLLLFGLLSSGAIGSSMVRALATLACAAGMGALAWAYWRRAGVWAYPDRTMWLTWVPLAVVVLVPAYVLADGHGRVWAMPAAGAVLGLALALLGRRWSRQWAAELRSAR
jgi:hypothetical protein